jgi:hypothetical protein
MREYDRGGVGPKQAIVVRPGEGRRVRNVEFLARSKDTPRFNLAVITMQPHREGPELHVHAAEDDSFYSQRLRRKKPSIPASTTTSAAMITQNASCVPSPG